MTNSTLDLIPNDQKNIQGLTTYEYKHIRLDYKGRGITQEINLLDIDGERIRSWRNNFGDDVIVPTLHEMLNQLGAAGWELVSHVVNQDVLQMVLLFTITISNDLLIKYLKGSNNGA